MSWNFSDPYGLALRNAIWLANEEFKFKKKAKEALLADRMAQRAMDDLSNMYTDWDLGCAAIILFEDYGFTPEEVSKFLTRVQELTVEYASQEEPTEDIWDKKIADKIWNRVGKYGLDIERVYDE